MPAAVGPLQFEVLQYRLKDEYKAESNLEMMPWKIMRWLEASADMEAARTGLPYDSALATDDHSRAVILFSTEWSCRYFMEKNPSIRLLEFPVDQ